MDNPLLIWQGLPPFSRIRPEQVVPAIDRTLAACRAQIERLTHHPHPPTWKHFVEPLEAANEQLDRTWSPVAHLNSVMDEEALRTAYNACLPKLSEYATEVGQNRALYAGFRAVAEQESLDAPRRKLVKNALRDFRLSGVDLAADKQARYKAISQEFAQLTSRYEENLLDATNAWSKHIEDLSALVGLPDSILALARQTAADRGKTGWVLTLDHPSYLPVMTYADDRELRRELGQFFQLPAGLGYGPFR